jgi:hypothetical protein
MDTSRGFKFIQSNYGLDVSSGFVITHITSDNKFLFFNGSEFTHYYKTGYHLKVRNNNILYNYGNNDLIIYYSENNLERQIEKITFFIDRKRRQIICSKYSILRGFDIDTIRDLKIVGINKLEIPNLKSINSKIVSQTFYVVIDGNDILSVYKGLNERGKPYKKLPKIDFTTYEIKEREFITKEASLKRRKWETLKGEIDLLVPLRTTDNLSSIVINCMLDNNLFSSNEKLETDNWEIIIKNKEFKPPECINLSWILPLNTERVRSMPWKKLNSGLDNINNNN